MFPLCFYYILCSLLQRQNSGINSINELNSVLLSYIEIFCFLPVWHIFLPGPVELSQFHIVLVSQHSQHKPEMTLEDSILV